MCKKCLLVYSLSEFIVKKRGSTSIQRTTTADIQSQPCTSASILNGVQRGRMNSEEELRPGEGWSLSALSTLAELSPPSEPHNRRVVGDAPQSKGICHSRTSSAQHLSREW